MKRSRGELAKREKICAIVPLLRGVRGVLTKRKTEKSCHAELVSAPHLLGDQHEVGLFCGILKQVQDDRGFGRCLRPGLYAHTAQALVTRPVSAAIPNAELRRASPTHPDYSAVSGWSTLSSLRGKRVSIKTSLKTKRPLRAA